MTPYTGITGPLWSKYTFFIGPGTILCFFQSLFQVVKQIIDIFQTDGNADRAAGDAGRFERFVIQLLMCRRSRMYEE